METRVETLLLVEQVRSFNRTMTERIGVLNDHYLGRNHPLGEARLIWEIGEQGATVRALRHRLGLDSAYVSRLLRSLESQGLIVVAPSRNDGRVRQVHLTAAGLRERSELDHRADAFARSLLEPLSEGERVKLVTAMAQVEPLIEGAFAGNAHAFLMLLYKNPCLPVGVRLDAAKAAIRYETPALSAITYEEKEIGRAHV